MDTLHGIDLELELVDILKQEIDNDSIDIFSKMIEEEIDRQIIADMVKKVEEEHKQNKEKLCTNGLKK